MVRVSARGAPGFTLMELLIVVIIVGILSTLALPQFPRAMERARQAEARAMLGQIYQAERIYYAEKDFYVTATPANNPTVASIPADTSPDNYFKYAVAVPEGGATFTATATRKIAADTTGNKGKAPPWTSAYTITLDQAGNFTVSSSF